MEYIRIKESRNELKITVQPSPAFFGILSFSSPNDHRLLSGNPYELIDILADSSKEAYMTCGIAGLGRSEGTSFPSRIFIRTSVMTGQAI